MSLLPLKRKGQRAPLPPEHLDVADALIAIPREMLTSWARGYAPTLARKVRQRAEPLTPAEMEYAKAIIKGDYSMKRSAGKRSRPTVGLSFAE